MIESQKKLIETGKREVEEVEDLINLTLKENTRQSGYNERLLYNYTGAYEDEKVNDRLFEEMDKINPDPNFSVQLSTIDDKEDLVQDKE